MTEALIFIAVLLILVTAILVALYAIIRDKPSQPQQQSYRTRPLVELQINEAAKLLTKDEARRIAAKAAATLAAEMPSQCGEQIHLCRLPRPSSTRVVLSHLPSRPVGELTARGSRSRQAPDHHLLPMAGATFFRGHDCHRIVKQKGCLVRRRCSSHISSQCRLEAAILPQWVINLRGQCLSRSIAPTVGPDTKSIGSRSRRVQLIAK
jgi:hypothetical protein